MEPSHSENGELNFAFRHALIMAAGRGLRMMPLTSNLPKPMAKFRDTTLIGDAIRNIRHAICNIHITVGYLGAELARHVIEIGAASVLNTEGHGNAWWIFETLLQHLDEPVLVLTCDNIVSLDYNSIARDYVELGEPACMVVPVSPIQGLAGDYIFSLENRVSKLSRDEISPIYCSGIQVLNPQKIQRLVEPNDDFNVVWAKLIEREALFCSNIHPDRWYAVDTVEQLERFSEI